MLNEYRFLSAGHELHCETAGDSNAATSIIFLHGLASNATRWRELMSESDMKDFAYLLAMNLRGHGHSLCFDRYTRQDWCNDTAELMKQTGRPTILIGHSLGAQVALELAARQLQDSLTGLVLIDPVFPQALSGRLQKVARYRRSVFVAGWLLRGLYKLGLHKRTYAYRDLQQLDEQTRAFLAENPDKDIAQLYMNPFADLKYIPLGNYIQDLYEVTGPLPELNTIEVPVLVLLSAGASTSNVDSNRQILAAIPDLNIKTIDADHWLLTEKPVEARKKIESWCRKQFGVQA